MPRPRSQLAKNITLVAFLAVGLLLVQAGTLPLWLWLVLTALTVVIRVLGQADAPFEELVIDDEGIRREFGSRMREKTVEALRWDALTAVEVVAHGGPGGKDLLFLLHGGADSGVAVAGELAERQGLLAALRRRLPGLREEAVADARACADRASFTLWEKQP